MSARRDPRLWLALGGAALCCALLLVAAGQPLFADDTWWHLALGRAFAAAGPWLADDPLIFGAPGPPAPAAWLFDRLLFAVHEAAGFAGLRALHVLLLAALLALAASLLRRGSGSLLFSALALASFATLGAYRFVQLRPHLFSMLALLALYRLLLEDRRTPGAPRIAAAVALSALWANLHAAFPLGPLMLATAALALGVAALCSGAADDRRRAARLGLAAALCGLATLANPLGAGAYAAWFEAGQSTPELAAVVDEWAPLNLLAWPTPTLPPSLQAWLGVWILLGACLLAAPGALSELGRSPEKRRSDPASVGVALLSLALLLSAGRFLWLSLFPLLWLGAAFAWRREELSPRFAWGLALCPALLAAAFLRAGDWPVVTRLMTRSLEGYAAPYPVQKYFAHPIWLLRDAELTGNLYCDYFQGGFVGYWLAPGVRTTANGSLNVPAGRLDAMQAIRLRRGGLPGESFADLLDRVGLDLFLGIRSPEVGHRYRPWASTTAHLEGTPGWIPVFRNLNSSLFVRDAPEQRENLARIAAYYAARRVPFDAQRGFEPLAAVSSAPGWAEAKGLVPAGFARLEHRAHNAEGQSGATARERVASIYAALGQYEQAVSLDRRILEADAEAGRARRRLVWSLLRLGRFDEARAEAERLAQRPERDWLAHEIARAADELAGGLGPEQARARVASLPLFYRRELPAVLAGTREAVARIH